MLSHSLLVVQCISLLCLTCSVSAAPKQEASRSPWSAFFQIARGNAAAPKPKQPLSLSTENSTECNEFPDPGYGGSDPPLYKYYSEASKIQAACWTESTVNKKQITYIRTTLGCYIDEEYVQAGNKDLQRALPECTKPKPYAVKTTKNEYLLKKDGFWMDCWDKPEKSGEKIEVQWGARHVWCSVTGETVGNSDVWWRDAHTTVVNLTGVAAKTWRAEGRATEKEHCYVPDDAFDNTVFKVEGGGVKCADVDK